MRQSGQAHDETFRDAFAEIARLGIRGRHREREDSDRCLTRIGRWTPDESVEREKQNRDREATDDDEVQPSSGDGWRIRRHVVRAPDTFRCQIIDPRKDHRDRKAQPEHDEDHAQ